MRVVSQASSARSGSGSTNASEGQRESASPSPIPARRPNASAAPEVCPMTCGPPGSGASATALPSSSRRSLSRVRSEKRGMRAQAIAIRTHVRTSCGGLQAGYVSIARGGTGDDWMIDVVV